MQVVVGGKAKGSTESVRAVQEASRAADEVVDA
jgi:hypothetical protein